MEGRKIKNLLEITKKDYQNAIDFLKSDKSGSEIIKSFLVEFVEKNENEKKFNVNNLKLLSNPNYIAAMNIINYEQAQFYKERGLFDGLKDNKTQVQFRTDTDTKQRLEDKAALYNLSLTDYLIFVGLHADIKVSTKFKN